ncbi:MAG TPA: hypothetical protein VJY33_24535 [Isosphaeraceae bacterium]|nr:hypothetical protein [Isosphaeraceae bacterium]
MSTIANLRAKRNALIAQIIEGHSRSPRWWDRKIAERQRLDRRIYELLHPDAPPEKPIPGARPAPPRHRGLDTDAIVTGFLVILASIAVTAISLFAGIRAAGGL